jgi:hypothetical protein
MYFNVLNVKGRPQCLYTFPFMLCNPHDDGQKWPKHVADNKRMHSVLRPVFALKINTVVMPSNICYDNKLYF